MNLWNNFRNSFLDEFRVVIKSPGVLLFLIALPLAYPPLYSLIYNEELVREVTVVAVDHDGSAYSRQLVRDMDATQEVKIIGYAQDLNEAKKAMDSRECYGILEIPVGFQKGIGRGETGHAVLYCDMTLLIRYRSLLTAATKVGPAFSSEIEAKDASLVNTLLPFDPMPVESVYLGDITGGYDSFLMPGILIMILQQCIIMAVSMAGGERNEEKKGYLRLQGSPAITLIGRTFVYLIMMILPVILLLYYIPMIFRLPQQPHVFEMFLFVVPLLLSSVMMGFTLQGLMKERESVFLVWAGLSIGCLLLSGFTWPRYAMPEGWKIVADIIPSTFGIIGYIRMNSNGAHLSEVAPEYLALWVQALCYYLLAIIIQYRLRKTEKKKFFYSGDYH